MIRKFGDREMLVGGCFCRNIRFEADGEPYNSTICHCSDCRKAAAAPFVAWFSMRVRDLRFIADQPTFFRSSANVTRSFCPRCGTQLTFQSSRSPDEIDIATCSLDDPELVPPRDHTRVEGRLSWIHLADDLPKFPVTRGSS